MENDIEPMERGAQISPCGRYRYSLWRKWKPGPLCTFIGLNPSFADATIDDPTIRRCVGFAKAWGYSGLMMLNLFAYRATKPGEMMTADDPVGPDNDEVLRDAGVNSAIQVAAWGANGSFLGRDKTVRAMLPELHCLRLTQAGHPSHPLYLSASLKPMAWKPHEATPKA